MCRRGIPIYQLPGYPCELYPVVYMDNSRRAVLKLGNDELIVVDFGDVGEGYQDLYTAYRLGKQADVKFRPHVLDCGKKSVRVEIGGHFDTYA